MRKNTIIILICIAIVFGILSGIVVSILDDKKLEEAQVNEIMKLNELIQSNALQNETVQDDIIATNQSEIKLSPNAIICFEKYYTDCGHTIVEKKQIEESEVNKTEEYIKNEYTDWKVESFSADEVNLYKEVEGTCDKHYLITIKDDNIAVYTIDEDGNTILKEVTDIPIMYLPEEDISLLEQGITANGDNELAKKLEDFE